MTQSAVREAELNRMHVLDEKLRLLEKKLSLRPKTCIGSVIENVCNVVRSIPLPSIIGIAPSLFGLFMMYHSHEKVIEAITQLDLGSKVHVFVSNIWTICICIFSVDVATFVVSFPATGPFREFLYGRVHSGPMMCFVCLVGPCFMTILLVLLFATFLGSFGAVQPTVYATTLLSLSFGVCSASDDKKAVFGKIMSAVLHIEDKKAATSITNLCGSDHQKDCAAAIFIFTMGLILVTVGQISLLVTHMNNLEKVWTQDDTDDSLGKELMYDYFKTHQFRGAFPRP